MWERELADATISAQILSQEELGREEFDPSIYGDVDVVLLDESHNFRNRNAQRFGNLERVLGSNAGRGRDGMRKKVILLSATPVSNDLFDLYNQFSLITQGDRSYFAAAGIGDLYRYFRQARSALQPAGRSCDPTDAELHPEGIPGSNNRRKEDPLPKARTKDGALQPRRNL
jgi:hypothetical protein